MSVTGERLYNVDDDLLETVRKEQAWTADPKYFKKVKISPSAIVKMMVHGQSGVDKGIKKSGKPIEVMGLLVGRPDTEDRNAIVISDAQPLPIEGFETKVIADDESTINYMIELGKLKYVNYVYLLHSHYRMQQRISTRHPLTSI